MASVLMVGNLLRRLEEFPMNKVDTRTAEELCNIEKTFRRLLSHLQYAECDLHDDEQGRSNDAVSFDLNKWRNSMIKHARKRTPIHRVVAVWAADVEEIVIIYNFHLLNMNTGTLYRKFLNSCSFMLDSNNVAANTISRASQMIQVFFPIDSAVGCVLLLRKVSEMLTSTEIVQWLENLDNKNGRKNNLLQAFGSIRSTYYKSQPAVSRTTQVRKNLESAHMVGWAEEVKLLDEWLLLGGEKSPDQPQPAVGDYLSDHDSRTTQVRTNLESAGMVGRTEEVKLLEEWLSLGEEKSPDQPQPAVGDYLSDHDSRTTQVRKNLESARMVGRSEEVKLLEGWLLSEEEKSPDIIIISGEAGIGKTTVAETVYEQVQKHFDCHAWVFVSRNDSTRHIMQNILKGILKSISVMAPNNIDTMGEKPLKKLINSWLIGKRFLLILDDVSSQDIVQEFIDTIPEGIITAKVLVTSQGRNFRIGHEIFKLNPIYSSDLLHKHACSSERGKEFFLSVQSVADEIVKLCRGLPLAIVTVGRMLSTKHKVEDWNKVHLVLKERAFFMPLCYADLSPTLQSCFLYAASFPCQFEISCKKLKRLWIAEGFVKHDKNRTLEESVQLQLEELIHRNMIQVVKRNIDGEVKTCRILRMMRDFALTRSEGVGFSAILKNLKSNLPKKCHRALLYGASNDIGSSTSKFSRQDFSKLYSFLALEENQHQAPLNLNDFRLLSVLELKGFCHELLPDAIGDLALLRYLGLRGGKIKKLPVSLKKLSRLQTLDIRDTLVRDLPDDLQGLGDLRHLLLEGSFTDKVVNLRDGNIEAFKDLQTLSGLKMTEAIAVGLIDLRGIRKLSIGEVQGSHLAPLFEAVERMDFLRSFTMKGSFEDQSDKISLPSLYSLEKLRIGGPTKNNLLDWVGKLHCLKCLYFWDSKLTKDPLCALQHLSNLIVLSLCNSYDGKDIKFGNGGFSKLKKLSILHCPNLENWKEIPDGAMTQLETLNIGYCPALVKLPKGLEKLNSFCSIQISNMPSQFIQEVYELHSISNDSISIRGGNIKIPSPVKLSSLPKTLSYRIGQDVDEIVASTPAHSSNKVETKSDQKSSKSWADMADEERQVSPPPMRRNRVQ